jgi:hypothetical protein
LPVKYEMDYVAGKFSILAASKIACGFAKGPFV